MGVLGEGRGFYSIEMRAEIGGFLIKSMPPRRHEAAKTDAKKRNFTTKSRRHGEEIEKWFHNHHAGV
jgi:hypothetical protein